MSFSLANGEQFGSWLDGWFMDSKAFSFDSSKKKNSIWTFVFLAVAIGIVAINCENLIILRARSQSILICVIIQIDFFINLKKNVAFGCVCAQ